MKLLVDENLSPKLVVLLADLFPASVHVPDRGIFDVEPMKRKSTLVSLLVVICSASAIIVWREHIVMGLFDLVFKSKSDVVLAQFNHGAGKGRVAFRDPAGIQGGGAGHLVLVLDHPNKSDSYYLIAEIYRRASADVEAQGLNDGSIRIIDNEFRTSWSISVDARTVRAENGNVLSPAQPRKLE